MESDKAIDVKAAFHGNVLSNVTTTKDDAPSDVDRALAGADRALSNMDELLSILHARLGPVLIQVELLEPPASPREGFGTPLATGIDSLAAHAEALNLRLRETIDRLGI